MKELTRWMIVVRVNGMTYVVNDEGDLSLHHIPQVYLNKEVAERVAGRFADASVVIWEGR